MASGRARSDQGQATVEHVGLVLLVALAFVSLAVLPPLPGAGEPLAASLAGAFRAEPTPGAPRPSEATWSEERTVVDRYMDVPLREFLIYRESPSRDLRLDYSTDYCSAPLVGSTGGSFDFSAACVRHDFGYRNYDRLGIFRRRKDEVDARFLADMRAHCATRPPDEQGRCRAWARLFYEAVQRFGHITGYG